MDQSPKAERQALEAVILNQMHVILSLENELLLTQRALIHLAYDNKDEARKIIDELLQKQKEDFSQNTLDTFDAWIDSTNG